VPAPVWLLAGLCALPELVLLGADWGLWGSARWRPAAWAWGGFWAGLLQGWTPNFALQPATMFLSYGWLHAGPGHLAGNLVALLWLGPAAVGRFGARGLAGLWAAGLLGGGAAFALTGPGAAPMVGASGALFGLAAALAVAEARAQPTPARAWGRAALWLGALVLLNAATFVALAGRLAWQAHLGGMAAGALWAALWAARRAARRRR
jgi:membrane associated rhomboid family serine protease